MVAYQSRGWNGTVGDRQIAECRQSRGIQPSPLHLSDFRRADAMSTVSARLANLFYPCREAENDHVVGLVC